MKREFNYLKAIVVVHGKSEKQMAEFIKQQLRLKMEIISDKNGEQSIQITSVMKKVFNNKIFKSKNIFLNKYDDIKLNEKGNNISDDFKIFVIMDTDDCPTDKQKEDFINKEMFKTSWLYDYIVPIYNSPELETILTKAGIPFKKEGDKRKKEYIKIFPTDEKYITSDVIQIEDFLKKLSKVKDTNMDEFVEFCLDQSK